MAIFEIEGPDGAIYEVDAPDEAAAIAGFQSAMGQASQADPRNPDGTYGQPPEGFVYNPQTGQMEDLRSPINPNIPTGTANALALGTGQGVGFNLLDEAVAGASTLFGGDYDYNLARMREAERRAQSEHPVAYYGGQVGGAVATGASLGGAGLSAATNAAKAGGGLGRVAAGSAIDGGIMGGLYGFGSGEGAENRAYNAGIGGALGAVAGGVMPYVVAGAKEVASPLMRPVMSRLYPDEYANRAMADAVKRSGMTTDDIANALARAQADDQGIYTVADAMGHSGQRALSSVARTPNDARQLVVDTLTNRQAGQGERLARYLAEGFDASDTAAQRVSALDAARAAAANTNYEAARQGAKAVDVSGALGAIDDVLSPGVNKIINPGADIADDGIQSVLRRVRARLTDGKSVVSDFNVVLRLKQDVADLISKATRAGENNKARILIGIQQQLDQALEAASPAYRAANDTFRQQSRVIDAVGLGQASTSGRTRSPDNIARFKALTPDEQAAFRVGYADPLIARVESTATSPTTNKARPLITDKTRAEFPAFAAPGKAQQLGRRIGREQRMFETANAALGGSKTADNLADAAELAKFDPSIFGNLLNGRWGTAALNAIGKAWAESRGMSPQVMEIYAKKLLETNPDAARRILESGAKTAFQDEMRRAIIARILGNVGAAAVPQVAP